MKRSVTIALVMVSMALLGGCAEESGWTPVPTTVAPSITPSVTPTPEQPVPATIVIGGDHWEVLDKAGAVMSTMSYTEPANDALQLLNHLLGEPTMTTYNGDECGQASARIYQWAGDQFGVTDRTGFTDIPPRDVVPYSLFTRTSEINGIAVTTTVGITIGGDPMVFDDADLSITGSDVTQIEVGGSFESAGADGAMRTTTWGLYSVAPTDLNKTEFLSAPNVQSDFYC
jgi:hypothetical protein